MKDNVFNFTSKDAELQTKVINKKKIAIAVLILLLIISGVTLLMVYSMNEEFRNFWDYSVLRKEVESTDVKSIALDKNSLRYTYSYDNRLVVLEKKILKVYNKDGNEDLNFDINISNPIYDDYNRFLVMAEKNGGKVYLINDNNLAWQKDLEGNISQVYVNKNGYVGVVMSATGYKTVIVLYNPYGEELFRTYLRSTYCVDMEISNDNKYMAIAELDSSGTMLETSVKIISVENAKTKPQEAFIATYNANSSNMVLNLKYSDDGRLIVMYDNSVSYASENMEEIVKISSEKTFVDIESPGKVVTIEKQSGGILNTKYILKILNTSNGKIIEYNLMEMPKELYVKDNVIAVNYGTDVEIISAQSGWLIKKYVSRIDIRNILISNSSVSIEYNDEIKLIKF